MKFTSEMIEKAKTAKTAEELLEMAKEVGVEMTAEEATKYFSDLGCEGELADEELDNVAGGACDHKYDSAEKALASANEKIGTKVQLGFLGKDGEIVAGSWYCKGDVYYEHLKVRWSDGSTSWEFLSDLYLIPKDGY